MNVNASQPRPGPKRSLPFCIPIYQKHINNVSWTFFRDACHVVDALGPSSPAPALTPAQDAYHRYHSQYGGDRLPVHASARAPSLSTPSSSLSFDGLKYKTPIFLTSTPTKWETKYFLFHFFFCCWYSRMASARRERWRWRRVAPKEKTRKVSGQV